MCSIDELTAARPAKYMKLQEFKSIVDQLPFLRAVNLTGIGESLLNTSLFKIIGYCAGRRLHTDVVTNGMLLDSKRGESLIRSGLSNLNVSMDSVNPETFREIRVKADLETVSENVKNFIGLRNSLGFKAPTVHVIIVASKKNKNELADILQHAYDLGAEGAYMRIFNPYHNTEMEIPAGDTDYYAVAMEKARNLRHAPRPFSTGMAFSSDKGSLCEWPWTMTYITVEGDVTPCCVVCDARKLSFGNVNNEPFVKIWNNPAYRDFRRAISHGVPRVCETCEVMRLSLRGKNRQERGQTTDLFKPTANLF